MVWDMRTAATIALAITMSILTISMAIRIRICANWRSAIYVSLRSLRNSQDALAAFLLRRPFLLMQSSPMDSHTRTGRRRGHSVPCGSGRQSAQSYTRWLRRHLLSRRVRNATTPTRSTSSATTVAPGIGPDQQRVLTKLRSAEQPTRPPRPPARPRLLRE